MTLNEELTSRTLNDEKWEEEWIVKMNDNTEYSLSKIQMLGLRQEIARGNRGIVMFQTFGISVPYIVHFDRVRRFLKGEFQLSARATEKPYEPIPEEVWNKIKKEAYEKIGKV